MEIGLLLIINVSEFLNGFTSFASKSEIEGLFFLCSVSLGDVAGKTKVEFALGVDVIKGGFLGVINDYF